MPALDTGSAALNGAVGIDAPEPPQLRRAASSRFSVLLETSVDYTAYQQACSRQRLQQPPRFETLRDAEEELRCVLHDKAFEGPHADGLIAAENVALVVDWFTNALARQFSGDEPFENPDFLRFCCMFFASPLYENNARLVQRHLVKRSYAELNVGAEDAAYVDTLWLLLALLHLITEFQADTYRLCTDSGLFPLLQRLVVAGVDKHLHVLAMSLMFEIAQAEQLPQTDLASVTDEMLLFLLDYIERMRYADSDVYNNTATKLVLALNEQMLEDAAPTLPMPSFGDQQTLALLAGSAQRSYGRRHRHRGSHRADGSMSVQSMSPPPEHRPLPPLGMPTQRTHHARAASVNLLGNDDAQTEQMRPAVSPAVHALDMEMHLISRSRSMDFRQQLCQRTPEAEQPPRPSSEACAGANPCAVDGTQFRPRRTRVVALLAQRVDCCKTFAENLVFLLNRETDPATQRLILHMLACILADPNTGGILYTNDLHVLTDIIIRDLSNVCDAEQKLRRSYLRVVCVLLRNPSYLAARHRLSDIELCLVSILRQSLVSSQASAVSTSRRGSVSETNTRHNSMAASDLGSSAELRLTGAASPALSLSSTASEETYCVRGSGSSDPVSVVSLQKPSRRPPPPLPPASAKQRAQAAPQVSSSLRPSSQSRRRRAPPPPPTLPASRSQNVSAHATPTSSPQLAPVGESLAPCSPRPARRKAPPPPPRSRPASGGQARPQSAKPPTPPPRTDLRKPKPEQTGIRRQLSVKKSVSRYKRDSIIGKPAPPLPPPRDSGKMAAPMSPVIEVPAEEGTFGGDAPEKPPGSGSETHIDAVGDSDDEEEEPPLDPSSAANAEERRATRVLVANALRSCHEARALALSLGPAIGSLG
ncbi:pre-rRNA processing [Coemansia sp. RSA 2702]|nr:pre-rRNA processing [Coemansia sp. RSA 2705]KAJ2325129.1 pre-rRNA processing [Coemansia sp. RSA 2702]